MSSVAERAGSLCSRLLAPLLLILSAAAATPDATSGQALPSHTATGITAGFNENAGRSFVRLLGRSGLVREGTEIADPMSRNVDGLAVAGGAILGGFTPHWTSRVIVPWVRKSMDFAAPDGRRLHYDASGVGEAILQSKWIFFRENRVQGTTRLGIQGRVFAPLGETEATLPTGEVAPQPLQVGDGSWDFEPTLVFTKTQGRLGLLANAGWRLNTESGGFEAGDAFSYDAAVGFRFVPWTYGSLKDQSVVAYLELNGEVAGEDRVGGELNPNSGGHVLFLSPDLQWIPTPWLLFEGSVQIPVLQDLSGTQLEHETRLQLGTRLRFSAFR